jgi:hypothetical protein
MPTYSKIPKKVREVGCIAINEWAIWCTGLLKAGVIMTRICRADKRGGLPLVGYVSYKGERVYYCRYGLVGDEDIYSKK